MSDSGREPDARAVFEVLVREHADMLEAYLRTLMGSGSSSSIDDVFQETMLVAWRRLGDYDTTRPLAAWLRGIAHVLVMEHFRKAKRRPASTEPEVLEAIDQRFAVLEHGPGDTFMQRAGGLLDCLAKLPETMREAINLVYARSVTIAEAAQSVGASEEAVKKRVQRGRQLLAECLGLGEHRS